MVPFISLITMFVCVGVVRKLAVKYIQLDVLRPDLVCHLTRTYIVLPWYEKTCFIFKGSTIFNKHGPLPTSNYQDVVNQVKRQKAA